MPDFNMKTFESEKKLDSEKSSSTDANAYCSYSSSARDNMQSIMSDKQQKELAQESELELKELAENKKPAPLTLEEWLLSNRSRVNALEELNRNKIQAQPHAINPVDKRLYLEITAAGRIQLQKRLKQQFKILKGLHEKALAEPDLELRRAQIRLLKKLRARFDRRNEYEQMIYWKFNAYIDETSAFKATELRDLANILDSDTPVGKISKGKDTSNSSGFSHASDGGLLFHSQKLMEVKNPDLVVSARDSVKTVQKGLNSAIFKPISSLRSSLSASVAYVATTDDTARLDKDVERHWPRLQRNLRWLEQLGKEAWSQGVELDPQELRAVLCLVQVDLGPAIALARQLNIRNQFLDQLAKAEAALFSVIGQIPNMVGRGQVSDSAFSRAERETMIKQTLEAAKKARISKIPAMSKRRVGDHDPLPSKGNVIKDFAGDLKAIYDANAAIVEIKTQQKKQKP